MHSNREGMETKFQRIAEKALKEPGCRFTSLFHLMDVELLKGCFEGLRKDAASGIDRVTKEEYGRELASGSVLSAAASNTGKSVSSKVNIQMRSRVR